MGSSYSCAKAFCGAQGPDEIDAVRSRKRLGHVQHALDGLLAAPGEGETGGASRPAGERDGDDLSMLAGPRSDDLEGPVRSGCSRGSCSSCTFDQYESYLAVRLETLAFVVSVLAALTGDMYIPLIPLHFADSGLPVGDAARATAAMPLMRLASTVLASRGILQGTTLQDGNLRWWQRLLRTILPTVYSLIGFCGFVLIAYMPYSPWAYTAFGLCMGPSMESLSCVQKLMTQRFSPTSRRGAKARSAAANLWICFQGGSAMSFVAAGVLYDNFSMEVVIYFGLIIQGILTILCFAFACGAAAPPPLSSASPRSSPSHSIHGSTPPSEEQLGADGVPTPVTGAAAAKAGATGALAAAAAAPAGRAMAVALSLRGAAPAVPLSKRTRPITVWPSIPIYCCLLCAFFGFGVVFLALCAGSATHFKAEFEVPAKISGAALAGSTALGVLIAQLIDRGWAPAVLTKTPLDLLAHIFLVALGAWLYCMVPVFSVGVLGQALVTTSYTLGVGCLVKTIQCYVPEASRGKQVLVGMACRLFGQAVGGAAVVGLRDGEGPGMSMLPVHIGAAMMTAAFVVLTLLFVQRLVHLESIGVAFLADEGRGEGRARVHSVGASAGQSASPLAVLASEAVGGLAGGKEGAGISGEQPARGTASDSGTEASAVTEASAAAAAGSGERAPERVPSMTNFSNFYAVARRFAKSASSLYELEVEHSVKQEVALTRSTSAATQLSSGAGDADSSEDSKEHKVATQLPPLSDEGEEQAGWGSSPKPSPPLSEGPLDRKSPPDGDVWQDPAHQV